ncbi:hypothetical protein U1527_21030, partial [Aeromonas caviae]
CLATNQIAQTGLSSLPPVIYYSEQLFRSDKAFQKMWAITALAYFHGLSNVSIRQQIAKEGLEDDGDGLTFLHEGLIYWIPKCSIKL